jgi:hypothetical protein
LDFSLAKAFTLWILLTALAKSGMTKALKKISVTPKKQWQKKPAAWQKLKSTLTENGYPSSGAGSPFSSGEKNTASPKAAKKILDKFSKS